jgi:FtsP/CotA-like multicopper oxidase with cupredoxin domain
MTSRRRFFTATAAASAAGATLAVTTPVAAQPPGARRWDDSYSGGARPQPPLPPGQPGEDYRPCVTPDGAALPWQLIDGVKVYHLVAEEVQHEFAPGLKGRCWGYNGRVHGPTLEAVEGDRVRVYVSNRLPAPTTVHWHGVFLPNGMDGVGGLTQRAIRPGETFKYEWTFRQHGTFMYHSHHDEMTQMGMGLMGMIVVHPRDPDPSVRVDRDYALLLSEWRINPGTYRPNVNEMTDFNVLTMNGRCFPGTAPLLARTGERVRIRFGNLSAMDHHPMHLHGHYFKVVATDGGDIPVSAQWPETTVIVPVGTTRDVEFIAGAPGDWALHCHMTHHLMNQMGHDAPNMVGVEPGDLDQRVRPLLPAYMTMGQHGMAEHGAHVEGGHLAVPENSIPMVGARGPFDYITMGGMFTIVKIRDDLEGDDDPGWYAHPPGTVANVAAASDLRRDGIKAPA